MEVHPPEHAIHNWRDFFIHIGTITIGLLIALGLEALVEYQHHLHLVHTAEANLRDELHQNRKLLAGDEQYLDVTQQQLEAGLAALQALKAHRTATDQGAAHWQWNGPLSAAWETARDDGALPLMSFEQAQMYAIVYTQQKVVDDQATVYIRDIYQISEPLYGKQKLSELNPAEIEAMIANTNHALADLSLLRDLSQSLDRIYANVEASAS